MSWWKRGKEGMAQAETEEQKFKERQQRGNIFEFFQARGNTTTMVFLDPGAEEGEFSPFFFSRHSVYDERTGRTTRATCLGYTEGCPLCAQNKDPKTNLAVTAICRMPFNDRWHNEDQICRDKEGNQWVYEKRVLVLQWKALENVKRNYVNKGKDLRFWLVNVSRGRAGQECATGETFDFERKFDPKNLANLKLKGEPSEWDKPVDYVEYFKPLSVADFCKKFGLEIPVGAEGDPRNAPAAEQPQAQSSAPDPGIDDPFGGPSSESSGGGDSSNDDVF